MRAVLFSLILVASTGCATLDGEAYTDSELAVRGYDSFSYLGADKTVNGQAGFTNHQPNYGHQYQTRRHRRFHREPYREGYFRYYSRGYLYPHSHHGGGRVFGHRFHYR